jgi:SAM-dependent MidA family methyltransferase
MLSPYLAERVHWIDELPARIDGVLIANEVLDAMPVHVIRTRDGAIEETGIASDAAGFVREPRPAKGELLAVATALDLPDDYETEINLAAKAFVTTAAHALERGALIFIDYGFPAAEYYHPQRSRGTLMCHYRHRAHEDPLALIGLQDITAHVDFTSIADAAVTAGASVLGYTSQAQFLINCGITDFLAELPAADTAAYAPRASEAQKLMSPAEMGELFKVIAFGRGIDVPLLGFARGDRTHKL